MKLLPFAAVTLAAALFAPAAGADDIADAVRACDELTASASDPDRRADPVLIQNIDVPAAIEACTKAIELAPDDGKLHFELGRTYESSGDFATAGEHYQRGADLGSPIAMRGLARLAFFGWGRAQDFEFAFKWYQAASDAGMVLATRELGANLIGPEVPAELRDYRRALEMLMLAVDKGDTEALRFVGEVYWLGPPDLRDYAKAEEWYLKSAEAGSPNGMNDLGRFYSNTPDREPEWNKAILWFESAIEAGSRSAANNLALIYYNGTGVEQDYRQAAELFQMASDGGILTSTHNLASMYDLGQGVTQDSVKAAELLFIAISRGSRDTYDVLAKDSDAYTAQTRRAFHQLLAEKGFYKGNTFDGVFEGEALAALDTAFGSAL